LVGQLQSCYASGPQRPTHLAIVDLMSNSSSETASATSSAANAPVHAISFASFRLDLAAGLLRQGARTIPLRPKTWAVLLYLAERPGTLVSKETLLDALWPGVAVTPDTLNKSIGELRVALGDDSHAPRYIETVHRRGFRFIAETRRSAAAARLADGGTRIAADDRVRADLAERPFVGRDDELRDLAAALARAQAGERQIVFLTGPAGIGKTATLDAFLDSPAVRDVTSVRIGRARCFEHHGPLEPYLPMLEALERLARPPIVESLLELMRRIAPMWLAQIPWLIRTADAEDLHQSLQGMGRERMPRELAALIEAFTADQTLVIALEDLHWCDPSTVDLLSLLAQRREPARLLVVGTYRPAELAVHEHVLAQAVRTLLTNRQCTAVGLEDLDEDHVRSYLARRFPGSNFPAALARLIHTHTAGNPLFVVGIVDHMRSRGLILDTEPGWALSMPPEAIDLGVPDDVRRMIEIQLDGLDPTERVVLEAASVAGSDITPSIVASAINREAGGTEHLCDTLASAQRFLHEAEPVMWPIGETQRSFSFIHELHRRVVYEEIPDGRRARFHQRVGEALEVAYGAQAGQIAAQLAIHFQRGRVPGRALHYLSLAGARARRLGASREAVGHLEPALALVAQLTDPEERLRTELDVRVAIGPALGDIHGFAADEVRTNYERVSELCSLTADPAGLFEALYARWYLHALRAERDETIALAEQIADLARQVCTPTCGQLADSVLLRTALYDGRFTDLEQHMASLLARPSEPATGSPPISYGINPFIAATMHYAIGRWFLGDIAGARSTADAGLARAHASGDLIALCAALFQAALLQLLSRNPAEGGALANHAAALAGEHGFGFWHAFASLLVGWSRVQTGDAIEGSSALERVLGVMAASRIRFFLSFALSFIAESHLRTGAIAAGLARVDEGLELTETTLDRSYAPELWRLKGELMLARAAPPAGRPRSKKTARPGVAGDEAWHEAEGCLVRALELAREAQAKSLELRAATSLARLRQAQGRAREAHLLLAEICDWFSADLDSPDLVEARGLLAKLA
jgi:DNA-binding winged helix-turn-helix (wHTH) protein